MSVCWGLAAESASEDDTWSKLAQQKGSEDKDIAKATEKGA